MKTTITLFAVTILAVFALAGCSQNTPSDSSDQATNSTVISTNGMAGGTTNPPVIVNLPDMNTNKPAITNQ